MADRLTNRQRNVMSGLPAREGHFTRHDARGARRRLPSCASPCSWGNPLVGGIVQSICTRRAGRVTCMSPPGLRVGH